jgi:hypothetical protein
MFYRSGLHFKSVASFTRHPWLGLLLWRRRVCQTHSEFQEVPTHCIGRQIKTRYYAYYRSAVICQVKRSKERTSRRRSSCRLRWLTYVYGQKSTVHTLELERTKLPQRFHHQWNERIIRQKRSPPPSARDDASEDRRRTPCSSCCLDWSANAYAIHKLAHYPTALSWLHAYK